MLILLQDCHHCYMQTILSIFTPTFTSVIFLILICCPPAVQSLLRMQMSGCIIMSSTPINITIIDWESDRTAGPPSYQSDLASSDIISSPARAVARPALFIFLETRNCRQRGLLCCQAISPPHHT